MRRTLVHETAMPPTNGRGVILLRKKTNADAIEDGQQNGPPPVAAEEASHQEVTPPPLPDSLPEPPPLPHDPPPLPVPLPVAQAAPTASVVLAAPDPALEERLRRLET